jgi:gas vesicle protein
LISVFLTGAVIAAVVGAVVNVALARRKSIEEERARVRTTFAEAFQTVAEYKEFPYAIRRRRHDQPEAERVRLSEALREVQTKLSYYLMWTKAESDEVGQAYETLVRELRKSAGKACREAWLAPPAREDKDMNFGRPGVIDLSGLKPYEEAFISASTRHLKEMRRLRRLLQRS